MNIFRTNADPLISADEMCSLHLTKMIMEYAQLMSAAHRELDGFGPLWLKHNGNDRKWWLHETDTVDEKGKLVRLTGYVLLAGMNMSHPAVKWICEGRDNYAWVFRSWERLLENFAEARGKKHEYEKLYEVLFDFPEKLPEGSTPPLKLVYPEYRHIQPVEEAYQAHINHKLTLPEFRNAVFEVKTPKWLDRVPPKSYTQENREKLTGEDEGPPKPLKKGDEIVGFRESKKEKVFNLKAPSLKKGTPPDIIKAADRVLSVEHHRTTEGEDKPLKVIKNGPPRFKVPGKKE